MQIQFLGATQSVTGSKYLVSSGGRRVLVDCGLFQGDKELRVRNWTRFPIAPRDIDAVVLTHAHLDHSGYLPLLVKNGFSGRVFCTEATRELCSVLLPDSGHIQEEDALYANRKGFSKHHPAEALYTRDDALRALDQFTPIAWETEHYLGGGLHAQWVRAGHILGAASVRLHDATRSILFSGDVGRFEDPTMLPPASAPGADCLLIESTYGDRLHGHDDPGVTLGRIVARTIERGGVVVIPAFAVGRAQTILYLIQRLKHAHAIPDVPVFLDSPMAEDVTEIFGRHLSDHRLDAATAAATCRAATFVRTSAQSKSLSASTQPAIIVSASGMMTGGRVLHHVAAFGPDARNTILLVGYQAVGTRGAALVRGAETLRIHGADVPMRAEVASIDDLSAHADADELMRWLRNVSRAPNHVYVTHGEPHASRAFGERIGRELGWSWSVPNYLDRADVTTQRSGSVLTK
ncbi:MAG: MBL fold metallo-hydrolase RNA specificity domain-containing protein [Polyangiales bacterium]